MLFEIESGQVTRWTIYDDLRQALNALGLKQK